MTKVYIKEIGFCTDAITKKPLSNNFYIELSDGKNTHIMNVLAFDIFALKKSYKYLKIKNHK